MIHKKTQAEIELMHEGGKKLAKIRDFLKDSITPGVTPLELDEMAEKKIIEAGGESSFKKVRGYKWTTCININDGVVHGIPTKKPIQDKDLVKLDVGMFYKGFHTDTSFTVQAGTDEPEVDKFVAVGREALKKAIHEARIGNKIGHISLAMQQVFDKYGVSPVRALTGHGVGKTLHEEPQIPCFWEGDPEKSQEIVLGSVFAIEAIYTQGDPDLVVLEDNWTIATKDGKIAGLFEETVAVTDKGNLVLTA